MIEKPEFMREEEVCTIIFHAEEELPLVVEQAQLWKLITHRARN